MIELAEAPSADLWRTLTNLAPATMSTDDLVAAIVACERMKSAVEAYQNDLLVAWERAGHSDQPEVEFYVYGKRARWRIEGLALELGVSAYTAGRRVDTAMVLIETLPQLHAALRCGQVTTHHARMTANAARHLPPDVARAADSAVMSEDGWRTPSQLERTFQGHVLRLDPKGAAQRHRAARKDRQVSVRDQPDGMASAYALLPADDAQALIKTLDACALSSKATNTPGDDRTLAQRRADALVELVSGGSSWSSTFRAAGEESPAATTETADTASTTETAGTTGTTGTTETAGAAGTTETAGAAGTTETAGTAPAGGAGGGSAEDEDVTTTTDTTAAGTTTTGNATADTASTGNGGGGTDGENVTATTDTATAGSATGSCTCGGTGTTTDAAPTASTVRRDAKTHGRRVDVQVTVSMSTLIGCDDAPAMLTGYGWIDATTARRICADPSATWRRLLVDPTSGALLDYGRTVYRPPADLRDFVIARDITCRFPNCDRPAMVCELDHRQEYDHTGDGTSGGATSPDNVDVLCKRHHRLKHEGGWTHHRDPDTHDSVWTDPQGHEYRKDASWLPAPAPVQAPAPTEPVEPAEPAVPSDLDLDEPPF